MRIRQATATLVLAALAVGHTPSLAGGQEVPGPFVDPGSNTTKVVFIVTAALAVAAVVKLAIGVAKGDDAKLDVRAVPPSGGSSVSMADQQFTLRNKGKRLLSVTNVVLTGTCFSLVAPPALPLRLGPNQTTSLSVRSSADAKACRETLQIEWDGGKGVREMSVRVTRP